jgi:hypothetical protein
MSYRVELFAEQDTVGPADVIELWKRETGMPDDEAARRLHEVLFVALGDDGQLIGVSSAYLLRNEQLRMDLWYCRAYTAPGHRREAVGVTLMHRARELLEERFTSGADRRGAGTAVEVESEVLQRDFRPAIWPQTGLAFIGKNASGWHVRVRYFPGALAPDP